MQKETARLRRDIDRVQREIDNLNTALAQSANTAPNSTLKAIEDREQQIQSLEQQLVTTKIDSLANRLNGIKLTDEVIEQIRKEAMPALDNEIKRVIITGDSVSIKFAFQKPPDSLPVMVAGVGFEPTTFGL